MELIKHPLYIHPTKTGGASVVAVLQDNGVECPLHTFLKDTNYEDRFIISSVRNPYTRLFSQFNFFKGNDRNNIPRNTTFKEFIVSYGAYNGNEVLFHTCYNLLSINGVLKTDFIIKMENIESDFDRLCNILNIPNTLPHLNKSEDTTPTFHMGIFDDEMIEIINNKFHNNFIYFDYEKYKTKQ